jgi:hypothetical protein
MTKEKMLEELSTISSMIAELPWWQKNLLDECTKATSTTPRPTEPTATHANDFPSSLSSNSGSFEKSCNQ